MSIRMVTISVAVCSLVAWSHPSVLADVVPKDHPLRRKPTVANVSGDELPEPTLLGTPRTRTLLGYMRRPLHLPDGNTMALFSFSGSGTANWLFLIDLRDLSSQRYEMPNHDVGSHGAAFRHVAVSRCGVSSSRSGTGACRCAAAVPGRRPPATP